MFNPQPNRKLFAFISPAQRGNTMMEYGVVGMLVVVAIIGVMLGVGNNLNVWFGSLKQDMKETANSASARAKVVEQGKHAASIAEAAKKAAANTTASGNPVAMITVTPATAPQTVGARGTDALAQEIRVLANKYLATGNLSPADHDLVMQVANKGHDIAVLQGYLESARRDANGNAMAYNNFRFSFNGQQYSPEALMGELGSSISEFQSLKSKAQASLNVKNSLELLGALEISGGQIIINGGDVMDKNRSGDNAVYVGNMEVNDPNVARNAANTHENSANICTTGQHQDSGTNCSP